MFLVDRNDSKTRAEIIDKYFGEMKELIAERDKKRPRDYYQRKLFQKR